MRIDLQTGERYLLDFDTNRLPRYTTDVLVIGAGIAGLSAALESAPCGHVVLVHKDDLAQANTAWAQGGVAAAVGADDSIEDHVEDTLRTGRGLCDRNVVEAVAGQAPAAIERLAARGTVFDRDGDGYSLGREGGHSRRRVLHARGDGTGAECSRALHEAVRRDSRIELLTRMFVIDLLTPEGRCVGVLARRQGGEVVVLLAKTVILASGGAGRLWRETSNVRGATGDGIAAAFRAGAVLRDLEFTQFHPTTLYLAGSDRVLVTEAVRGEGAYLIDNHGDRFLQEVHPSAELAPRDVVSRAIVAHLGRADVRDVFLDLRHLEPGRVARRFPGLAATCGRYGLDPERDPIPVRPAAHYFIGGLETDLDGRTSVPGLFACGEASCSGMHGANRLASNSLLEGIVLGARAGRAAREELASGFRGRITHRTGRTERRTDIDLDDLRESLNSCMWWRVGIQRDGAGLRAASDSITRWRHFAARLNLFGRAGFEVENLLLLGALVTESGLLREESRGTHGRSDFPEPDDHAFLGHFRWRAGAEPEFVKPRTQP